MLVKNKFSSKIMLHFSVALKYFQIMQKKSTVYVFGKGKLQLEF